jgi:hypothetical protein
VGRLLFLLYRVCFVSIDNIFVLLCEMLCTYKGDSSRCTICACYSWEVALNVGLDVSFSNVEGWKTIRGGIMGS